MTSYDVISSHMVFKFAYMVDLTKGYQPEKFQCCKLSGSSFTEELQKYIFLALEIFIFCESIYTLSVWQLSSYSVI